MFDKSTNPFVIALSAGLIIVMSATVPASAQHKLKQSSSRSQGAGFQVKPVSKTRPDILVRNVSLTEDGKVQYELGNPAFARVSTPFVVDIYVGKAHRETIRHDSIPGRGKQAKISRNVRIESCQGSWVRIVVDPQRLVSESNEANNERRFLARSRSCPDLAVTYGPFPKAVPRLVHTGEYFIQIEIGNVGTGPMSGPAIAEVLYGKKRLEYVDQLEIPSLPAGEIKKFALGATGTRKGWVVDVRLDPDNEIDELNERNNRKRWSN